MLFPDPFPVNPRRSITNSAFDASLVGGREYTPKGAGLTPRTPEEVAQLRADNSQLAAAHREQNSGYDMSHTGANATLIGNAELAELRRKAAFYDENEKALKRAPLMHAALRRIQTWFGMFPATGQFWDKDRKDPMSYAACYGSNGERDYMREVAREALESPIPSDGK